MPEAQVVKKIKPVNAGFSKARGKRNLTSVIKKALGTEASKEWGIDMSTSEDGETIDNVRHAAASYHLARTVKDKVGNTTLGKIPGVKNVAAFLTSLTGGAAHEINNFNNDYGFLPGMWEAGEDMFNNAYGAGMAAFTPKTHDEALDKIWEKSTTNKLPDGVVTPVKAQPVVKGNEGIENFLEDMTTSGKMGNLYFQKAGPVPQDKQLKYKNGTSRKGVANNTDMDYTDKINEFLGIDGEDASATGGQGGGASMFGTYAQMFNSGVVAPLSMLARDIKSADDKNQEYFESTNPLMAYGGQAGTADVVLEKGEVEKDPYTDVAMEVKDGASHEEGGSPRKVRKGTKVYSKRIKVGGKTMAKRELSRKNKEEKIAKKEEKLPGDPIFAKTAARIRDNIKREEQEDLKVQEFFNKVTAAANVFGEVAMGTGKDGVYAGGTDKWGVPLTIGGGIPLPLEGFRNFVLQQDEGFDFGKLGIDPNDPDKDRGPRHKAAWDLYGDAFTDHVQTGLAELNDPIEGTLVDELPAPDVSLDNIEGKYQGEDMADPDMDNIPGLVADMANVEQGGEFFLRDTPEESDPTLTTGDKMGMTSLGIEAAGPTAMTILNRTGEKPYKNFYKNYGKKAINRLEQGRTKVGQVADLEREGVKTSAETTRKRLKNSSRTLNVRRAVDLAVSGMEQDQRRKIAAGELEALGRYDTMIGNAMLQQDDKVMAGEQKLADVNEERRDNFFSKMSEDLVRTGEAGQKLAKAMNEDEYKKTFLDILPDISMYDYGFDQKRGKWVMTTKSGEVIDMPWEGIVEATEEGAEKE